MSRCRIAGILCPTTLVFLALVSASSVLADTNVSGTISTNTTWTTAASPYVVVGNVFVNSGVTLTIEAGVTVKFNSGLRLDVSGTLSAVGSSGSGITFTSNQVTPTPGYWTGLVFGSGTPASQITYASVSWAATGITVNGGAPAFTNVSVAHSSLNGILVQSPGAPTIQSCSVDTSGNYGLNVSGSTGVISLTSTSFTNNAWYPVIVNDTTNLSGLTGLTATGNGSGNSIAIRKTFYGITGNTTWRNASLPYAVQEGVGVGAAGTLTIEPGTVLKFKYHAGGISATGRLLANGTSGAPITMTSERATPAAGDWNGITLQSSNASSLSYVNLSWATTGIMVNVGSPALTNVSVAHSSLNGILLQTTGAPTVQSCSVDTSGNYGLNVSGSTGVISLTSTSFTNNAWYPVIVNDTTNLSGLTGLTATGNGSGNSIAIRKTFYGITGNTTWRYASLPYAVLEGVGVGAAGTLTIEPGTTLKFKYHAGALTVNGVLQAVGTPAAPITMTSEAATPTAGDWSGLTFSVSGTSNLTYANVSYTGYGAHAGALLNSGTTQFDHVTFSNYSSPGIQATSANVSATISNSAFLGASGLVNTYTANPLMARFNYWNSLTGPSGSGSGNGASVSGAYFEPWLTSAPSYPNWFTSGVVLNRTFNPSIGVNQIINFGTVASGNWTATWKDAAGNAIRAMSGSGATGSVTWDGKNDAGIAQPNGTYSLNVSSTGSGGDVASPIRGVSIINNALAFTITTPTVSQAFFSPNADGIKDTTTIAATASFDGATWTVNVLNGGGATVRSYSGSGQAISYTWDGKNSGAIVQPDGLYTLQIAAVDGLAQTGGSGTTTLDNTPPSLTITAPTSSQTISNVYQNGSADFAIIGSVTDINVATWEVDYGVGASPGSWSALAWGTSQVTNGTLVTWSTFVRTNGVYSVRLISSDKAGNSATTSVNGFTLGNFKITPNVWQFNAAAGGSVTYTSIIPFQLTESLLIKTQSGSTAQTLASGVRTPTTYTDSWNAASNLDGPYYFFATVTDGTHSMTVDGSTPAGVTYYVYPYFQPFTTFDPFNNRPEVLTFTVQSCACDPRGVGLVTVDLGPWGALGNCNPPNYCPLNNTLMAAGTHQIVWTGVDSTGAFRSDIGGAQMREDTGGIGIGALLVWGRKPAITNVQVTPPRFGPMNGTQAVTFTLATYQSQSVPLTVTFLNHGSLSTLRTISIPSQAPGNVNVTWDGRAGDGSLVAPGGYTVTITATDSLGNIGIGQTVTKVEY